jgi:hypothetical protein
MGLLPISSPSWEDDSLNQIQFNKDDQVEILYRFASTLIKNQEDLNPDFSKTVDEHFWELI